MVINQLSRKGEFVKTLENAREVSWHKIEHLG